MEPYFVLAESYARANRNDLAFSALPDAPVLPYVARKRRLRRIAANLRMLPARVRVPAGRRARRHTQACST